MRILITASIFPPEIGGPATYAKEFAVRSKEAGHKVSIVTLSDVESERVKGIDLTQVKRTRNFLMRNSAFFSSILNKARDCDVIYAQNPAAVGLPSVLAGKLIGKPVVVKFVGDSAWEKAFRDGKTKMFLEDFLGDPDANKNIIRVERLVFRWATRIITPSNFLKRVLVELHGVPEDKIVVIPNAADISELNVIPKTKPADKKTAIITVARLVPWKGVQDLIKILPELQKSAKTELWVVGDGPYRKELEKLAKGSDVTFFGNLSHKETLLRIASARVFVLNSLYEGLPHVLLEAMAVGTPIVATNICGNPEVVENQKNGLLVEPKNNKELKEAIESILNDDNKARAFSENGLQKAKQYTWRPLMEKTLDVLSSL